MSLEDAYAFLDRERAKRTAAAPTTKTGDAPAWREPLRKYKRPRQAHGQPLSEHTRQRIARTKFEQAWRNVDLSTVPPLTRARVQRGWTIDAAAREVGICRATFLAAVKGDHVSSETLRRLRQTFPEAYPDA